MEFKVFEKIMLRIELILAILAIALAFIGNIIDISLLAWISLIPLIGAIGTALALMISILVRYHLWKKEHIIK